MKDHRVLAPTALLGYGFPLASLAEGMSRHPDVVAVDGGSTDGGPYYLGVEPNGGTGGDQARAFAETIRRDLEPLLKAAREARVPLIIGSAGFAGGDLHLMGTVAVLRGIAEAAGMHFRLAVIPAEIEKSYVKDKLGAGEISPCGPVPDLSNEEIDAAVRIVAQMGPEPFIEALDAGADVVVAGRANDPSVFAASALREGHDAGLALHMAKILECGAIAAEPGSGSDALLGTLRDDDFLLEPLNPARRCTTRSVAAHSLYEKADPLRLYGPGGHVDLSAASYEQHDERTVRVSGSVYRPDACVRIKLEGSRRVGYRSFAIAGVRDPSVIAHLDELIEAARDGVADKFADVDPNAYELAFRVYGRDAVLGAREPVVGASHELGLVIDAVAESQALATSLCGHARTVMVHHGFAGRISTAGNLAFPFSPMDVPAGPVYRFNIYHLVDEPDPSSLFPVHVMEV